MNNTLLERVIFRRAHAGDRDAVFNINKDIHGGSDRVPPNFLKYLADPKRALFVAELDGKVVSFVMARLIDGGRTFLSSGGRSSPEIFGHGIYQRIQAYKTMECLKTWHTVQSERGSMWVDQLLQVFKLDPASFVKAEYQPNPPIRSILLSGYMAYTTFPVKKLCVPIAINVKRNQFERACSPDRVLNLGVDLPVNRVTRAGEELLHKIFTDVPTRKQITTDPVLMLSFEAYGFYDENIPEILGSVSNMYSTKNKFTFQLESASFGLATKCVSGLRYDIDYFGPSDKDLVLAHLLHHLPEIPTFYEEGLYHVSLCVPQDFVGDCLLSYLAEHFSFGNHQQKCQLVVVTNTVAMRTILSNI